MELLRKIAAAPGTAHRFLQLYGQHLPRAFDALFSLPCIVTTLQGTLRGTDEKISVLYAGRRVNYHYLLRTIFEEHRETQRTSTNLLMVKSHMERLAARSDVEILDLGWPYNNLFRRSRRYLEVPDWLNMAIDLPDDWDGVVRNFRRTARKHDLRLIRRNGYRCEQATGRAAMERFYDDMYLPFVEHRHAGESVTSPRKHVIKRGMQGTLLHVMRGDEVVAGGIIYPENGIMFSLWMGVPREHLASQPEAAISALYYFGVRFAFDEGYRTFDFTGTRAFLNDGAYQFKRRWGPLIDDAFSPGSILIRPQNGNRKAALFCAQVPVIGRTANGLEAVFVRLDGQVDEETFARLEKDFGCGGIDRVTVIEISQENETSAMPNGANGCHHRVLKCPLDRFADCYVKR